MVAPRTNKTDRETDDVYTSEAQHRATRRSRVVLHAP